MPIAFPRNLHYIIGTITIC